MATGPAAQNGLVERRTTTQSFDEFGNVTHVSTQARGEATNRTLSSNYKFTSFDYFPDRVTDALGAVTESTFDNRFGKPSAIKDPNQLTSTTSFDGMGREIGMVFPSKSMVNGTSAPVVNQLAPPKRIAYESCASNTCPVGTVLRVVSDQRGTPDVSPLTQKFWQVS